MLQDLGGHFWKPLGRTSWYPGVILTSAIIVALWGWLLWVGANDPNGGIKSLWALFGISNQMLAAIALSTVTTIFIKMGKVKYLWVTLVPMAWLIATTFSAAIMRIFHSDPRIGFLALADARQALIDGGKLTGKALTDAQTVVFNNRFDAAIGLALVIVVTLIVLESIRQWYLLLSGKKVGKLTEEPRVELTPELERELEVMGAGGH